MKNFLPIICAVIMATGCQKTTTSSADLIDVKNLDIYNSQNMTSVRSAFDLIVDDVFKYPYSSVSYSPFLNGPLGIDGPKEPLAQIANNCIKSKDVQIQSIKNKDNEIISFKFYTPIEKIKNCIVKESNAPINADALIDLNKSAIFKEYSDNPFLRETLDNLKSDGVITVKEYMDIIQIIIKLDKAGKAVQLEKVIKDL